MKKSPTAILALVLTLILLSGCSSKEYRVEITDPWARPAAKGDNSTVYFQIRNRGAEDRLISAGCSDAENVTLHRMQYSSGVAEMVQLKSVTFPAGGSYKFEPGEAYVLLENIKHSLREGETIDLILEFERGGKQTVEVSIDDR